MTERQANYRSSDSFKFWKNVRVNLFFISLYEGVYLKADSYNKKAGQT